MPPNYNNNTLSKLFCNVYFTISNIPHTAFPTPKTLRQLMFSEEHMEYDRIIDQVYC